MNEVMAVILNYNTFNDSVRCAELLKRQKNVQLNITIVDNNSNDGKVDELRQYCQNNGIIFIRNDKNDGFSAGNNLGLRKAAELKCRYAMIINPDVEIRDDEYICQSIKVMGSDDNIAVLGTNVINAKGQHQNPLRELKYWEEVLWPVILIRNKIIKSLPYVENYSKSGYCEKVSGCCFFIDVNFIEQIGYLDEKVFMYSEEPILAAVVKREGKKEYYLHSQVAYHMHKESEKGASGRRLEQFFKSRKYYLQKYSGYGKIRQKVAYFSINLQKKIMLNRNR